MNLERRRLKIKKHSSRIHTLAAYPAMPRNHRVSRDPGFNVLKLRVFYVALVVTPIMACRNVTARSIVSRPWLQFPSLFEKSSIRRLWEPSRRACQILLAACVGLMTGSLCAAEISSKQLAKASVGSGETLFENLQVEYTGIDFSFFWDPPDKYKWLFDGSLGGGVALADYDSDGRVDIFLTRAFGGSRLYRNLGDFRFDDVTEKAGIQDDGSWGMGATFADIENDGDLDLFVCSYDAPNRLFINQGDGTFIENAKEAGLAFSGSSTQMAFADYDLDGDLDAYLLTWRYINPETYGEFVEFKVKDGRRVVPEAYADAIGFITKPDGSRVPIKVGQKDRLYRNDGEGRFTEVTEASEISGNDMGLGVVWWDYNGDGWPDLYVANDYKGADKLYHNNQDGTFTDVIREAIPHTPWFSMGADAGDINNDGFLDFITSDMAGTSHYKQKLNMGEMDAEGWFLETAEPRQYMANAVYIHSGAGRFLEAAQLMGLSSTDWTWSIKLDDFDNDGWQDLFVSNGMTRNWFNSDLIAEQARLGGMGNPRGARIFLDSPMLREKNLAFRNDGDLHFDKIGQNWGLDHEGVSFGAATADLDGDGDLDLVVNNLDEPVSIYRNQGTTGNRMTVFLRGTTSNRFALGTLVRIETDKGIQVRYLSTTAGYVSSDDVALHFGLGESTQIRKLSVRWPNGGTSEFQDLEAGYAYTITEDAQTSVTDDEESEETRFLRWEGLAGIEHREDAYNDFGDQPLLPNRMSRLGPGMAWTRNPETGALTAFLAGATGQAGSLNHIGEEETLSGNTDTETFQNDAAREDMGGLFFDFDGDGDEDLYTVSGGLGRFPGDFLLGDRLYINDGAGGYERAGSDVLPAGNASGSVAAAADFDRDGDLDLFIGSRFMPRRYPETPISRLLVNSGGAFKDATENLAPELAKTGLVTSALWSDADGDGWLDLLVTHEWGPVKYYHNDRGKLTDRTARSGLANYKGWWNGITGRDIDNDGDIDYAVSNFGLNTKYHPSVSKPVELYYGEFGDQDEMRLVEAKYEADTLYPVRGKSCSTAAMPFLGDQIPSFHEFAKLSLAEIFTPECLDTSLRLEVNELASGILINTGDGRFSFKPLPRIAQISPGFGLALTDANGDGFSDLYMVQNFYSSQRETTRMDGGVSLLLDGNGDGTFSAVWPHRSGLIVPGDAKSLSSVDLNRDGWVDFVIGVNDGPVQAFKNAGQSGNQPLAINLKGERGNLAAVGSRVTVTNASEQRQTAEVYAGGGYLSQSTSTLFFGLGDSQLGEEIQIEVRWPTGEVTQYMKKVYGPYLDIGYKEKTL